MTLEWASLRERAGRRDVDAILAMLLEASEPERLAFGKELETRFKALQPEDWWQGRHDPAGGLGLAIIGTASTAAKAAALLGRREMRDKWDHIPPPHLIELVRARELPWVGDLGTRLAGRFNPQQGWSGGWKLVSALLSEAGAAPPLTEGVVRGWLVSVLQLHHLARERSFADRLRDSPYLDLMLPALFEIDGLGSELSGYSWDHVSGNWTSTPTFPAAIATLVAEGRLERKVILAATIDRLVRGDRPAWLRPFAMLHDALAPSADEMAGHALDYARLLPDAPSAIAGIAQRALRTVDEAGLLELETLLEVSRPTLVRKEKSLVKAQLSWLDRVARRESSPAVLETVAAAFEHPALVIQERALTLIARRAGSLDPATRAHLAGAAATLGGDLPGRAAELFGGAAPSSASGASPSSASGASPSSASGASPSSASGASPSSASGASASLASEALPSLALAASPSSGVSLSPGLGLLPASAGILLPPPGPEVMPAPIGSAVEMAEEVAALLQDQTAVRWERILAGLFTLRATDDMSPLLHLIERHQHVFDEPQWWPSHFGLGSAIRAIAQPSTPAPRPAAWHWNGLVAAVRARWSGAKQPQLAGAPDRLLELRVTEIAVLLPQSPISVLLATPTHVNGNLDAAVLVQRLQRAEAEGWEPWPLDFEQALLRLPRDTSPAVAAGLTSAAGRRLASWLAEGGLPEPVSTRFEQLAGTPWPNPVAGPPAVSRMVVNLVPARPARLSVEEEMLTLTRRPTASYGGDSHIRNASVLAATLPHHREVSAAWALPDLAALADRDERGGSGLLPLLADCDGPIGPAMSLAMAYVLAARHESDRVAAVDAFLALAATNPPTSEMPAHTAGAGGGGFTALVGRDLAGLAARDLVKLNRAVLSLTDAHRAGATASVWSLLDAALPVLLPAAPRGLPDLLELASVVAAASGVTGDIEGLTEVAEKKGSSRLVKEARRLRTVLGSSAEQ